MSRPIEHITLTSGAVRMSPRAEVRDDVVAEVARLMRTGGRLPGGWSVRVQPLEAGAWRFRLAVGLVPVVDCWLCASAEASDATWEAATAEGVADERVVLHRPRGVPWLAAALCPAGVAALSAGALTVDDLRAAGDAERCVAWAILSRDR